MEESNRKEIDTCIRYKRSGDIMTIGTMEKIYRKQAKGMKEYIDQLRSMPVEQAKEISKSNLMKAGIIKEDGTLTDRYPYSRKKGIQIV